MVGTLKPCFLWLTVQIELAYINTNHPDFMSNKALPGLFGDNASGRRDSCCRTIGRILRAA